MHNKFKIFVTQTLDDRYLERIEEYINGLRIGPKSIGIEYVESEDKIVMSLGYSEDEEYRIGLRLVRVGAYKTLEAAEIAEGMGRAAEEGVICHEFYVAPGEFGEGHIFYMLQMRIK